MNRFFYVQNDGQAFECFYKSPMVPVPSQDLVEAQKYSLSNGQTVTVFSEVQIELFKMSICRKSYFASETDPFNRFALDYQLSVYYQLGILKENEYSDILKQIKIKKKLLQHKKRKVQIKKAWAKMRKRRTLVLFDELHYIADISWAKSPYVEKMLLRKRESGVKFLVVQQSFDQINNLYSTPNDTEVTSISTQYPLVPYDHLEEVRCLLFSIPRGKYRD